MVHIIQTIIIMSIMGQTFIPIHTIALSVTLTVTTTTLDITMVQKMVTITITSMDTLGITAALLDTTQGIMVIHTHQVLDIIGPCLTGGIFITITTPIRITSRTSTPTMTGMQRGGTTPRTIITITLTQPLTASIQAAQAAQEVQRHQRLLGQLEIGAAQAEGVLL
jgi:hypothetical protein